MKPSKHRIQAFSRLCLVLSLSILCPRLIAQTNTSQVSNLQVKDSTGYLGVSFNLKTETSNLLILIHDSLGEVIFLESKRNFSGPYQKSINLKSHSPGEVRLSIINDEEKINQVVTLGK